MKRNHKRRRGGMRRLASHVSRSKRADKRWTTTTRPTPLNYESFSNEATLSLFLGRSLALSLFLARSLFRDHDTSALSLLHLSPSSPFPPAIIPRFIKACTDVNERGNCSLASFHCVAFRVFPPCLNGF